MRMLIRWSLLYSMVTCRMMCTQYSKWNLNYQQFQGALFPTCISIGDKLIEHQHEEVVHQAVQTTAQCTDNKDSIWIMLLISWGTGPFSVGACPWSLCSAAIDKHTHSTPRLSSITALRERYELPKTNASFCFFISSAMIRHFLLVEHHSIHTENKVMPALSYCTRCLLKRAIEERSENPVETWAAGNPLSTLVSAHETTMNLLAHLHKSVSTIWQPNRMFLLS